MSKRTQATPRERLLHNARVAYVELNTMGSKEAMDEDEKAGVMRDMAYFRRLLRAHERALLDAAAERGAKLGGQHPCGEDIRRAVRGRP